MPFICLVKKCKEERDFQYYKIVFDLSVCLNLLKAAFFVIDILNQLGENVNLPDNDI